MSTPLIKYILFPVGRLLWGSVSEVRTKDRSGKPLLTTSGEARSEVAFGVAFEKVPGQHWATTAWGADLWAIGHAAFPQQAQGKKFSWKVIDGDSTEPNENNKRPCDQQGYPGHWVVAFKSSFAPTAHNADGSQVIDPALIKCGNFIQVYGSADSNANTQKPGLYVNHSKVALAGYHPDGEIKTGPDAASVGFGTGAAPSRLQPVPAGALAAPAPPGAAPGGYAPPPPPSAANGAAPPPPPAAGAAPPPPVAVTPHTAILTPSAAPPPPPPAAVVIASAVPRLTARAPAGTTYEAFRAGGWSDDQLRQHGYIA